MAKIIGLDLGTNSIGWAIRDTEEEQNQIIDNGVLIFEKGVGDGKSGEFSLAAERRKNRSKRRLYNAKRYRKWELLKVLIENEMCPLTMDELRLWSIGNWQQVEVETINKETGEVSAEQKWKNKGRIYPIANEAFQQWLAFDPTVFGDKGKSENGKPIRKNPYDLRCELIIDEIAGQARNDDKKMLKIGRALYHLVQRRGFKSSRKSGQSAYAKNEDIEKLKAENADFQIALLAKEKLDKGERFRASGVIQRRYFEDEFFAICSKQNLSEELTEKLHKAIYFVRPLRSQKGLVGNCTLEKSKPRIPISHPKFEEFRALQFINNIKWREAGTQMYEPIPMSLKKKIFEELFFRKLTKGDNKGKINTDNYFKFDEIIKNYSKNGQYEFNYKNLPNVSTCPFIASLMNVFDEEWKDKFIQDENLYGINWDGLSINYKVKYGKKKGKNRNLRVDEIWHLLFDYLQTKDKQDELEKFCRDVLGFIPEKAKEFSDIDIPQGYGSLSYKSIAKILPFLQSGYIYSEAVLFANLKKVLGEKFEQSKEQAKKIIAQTIVEVGKTKEKLDIVNGLIQKFFADCETTHAKGVDDTIKELAIQETIDKLQSYFGKDDWDKKTETERTQLENEILNLYLRFLNGEQGKEEKASAKTDKNPEIDYYKLPRLDEAIKQRLKDNFNVSEKCLKYLYHPSDIDMYPVSKTGICEICDKIITDNKQIQDKDKCRSNDKNIGIKLLESPQPPSKAWKNPMAMRTLHELRHLLNYLLKTGKIDKDTKIVVEMARELNTKNYRKAYTDWITDKDNENKSYKASILELYGITEPSIDDYNKFRSAVEQIIELELSESKTSVFKQKYQEFIDMFLKTIKISDKNKDELMSDEYYDYMMYLIFSRNEFRKMLNFKLPNSNKWQTQLISTSVNFDKKRKELSEMLIKYRLWKQQKFQCIYTGQMISLTELFNSEKYQIEHTIPRSISFDSELKNLTICDAVYNSEVKGNLFPTQCPNYHRTQPCRTVRGIVDCTPIEDRVKRNILPKVKELHTRIKNLEVINKRLNDEDKKDANIRLRHYLQFELDYWEKKLLTFTVKKDEWKDKWKNSQLVDTQIISKYARAYLKTVFEKVDVQKGTVTSVFKKIYQIKGDEQKDRSKHSHHAVDAAVLTLIPSSAKREAILKIYFEMKDEKNTKGKTTLYYELSENLAKEVNKVLNLVEEDKDQDIDIQKYKMELNKFVNRNIRKIENNMIINHIIHDKALTDTFKKITISKKGKKIDTLAQGDSIRGQLHKESFFGAVKPNQLNENGYPVKDMKGKYLTQKDCNKEVIRYVKRDKIENVNINDIVDAALKKYIEKQMSEGTLKTELKDFNGKIIRHIRIFTSVKSPLSIKQQTYFSQKKEKSYKQKYYAEVGNLYLMCKYTRENSKSLFKTYDLFDISTKSKNIPQVIFDKDQNKFELDCVLKSGKKVLLYKTSPKEAIESINERLYVVLGFESPYRIILKWHLNAKKDIDMGKGENIKDWNELPEKIRCSVNTINFLLEGKDFEMKLDGTINFKESKI